MAGVKICSLERTELRQAELCSTCIHHEQLYRLRAAPSNITNIVVYASTSGHDENEVDHFYWQLQETINQKPKMDILIVQGDWKAKVGKGAYYGWGDHTKKAKNIREASDLSFAAFNNRVPTNTLDHTEGEYGTVQGPVVQSIVSSTGPLRGQLVKCFMTL